MYAIRSYYVIRDRISATSIIQGIGPQKYERNVRMGLRGCSGSSFRPCSSSRRATSESYNFV